jgi:hypothetical protein
VAQGEWNPWVQAPVPQQKKNPRKKSYQLKAKNTKKSWTWWCVASTSEAKTGDQLVLYSKALSQENKAKKKKKNMKIKLC